MSYKKSEPTYEDLRTICHDLEEQVSRFIKVEQDLIKAKSCLDAELSRFKVIQDFSQKALFAENSEALATLSVESAVALFEAECCFLLQVSETEKVDPDFAGVIGKASGLTNKLDLNREFYTMQFISSFGLESHPDKLRLHRGWLEKENSAFILDENSELLKSWSELEMVQMVLRPMFDSQCRFSKLLCIGRTRRNSIFFSPFKDEYTLSCDVLGRQIEGMYQKMDAQALIRKQMEELRALDQVKDQANRMKDEFLATLSHELRTPLNVIQGHVEILLQEDSSLTSEQVKNSLEAIVRNTHSQTQIINDLLDVSRIVTGKLSFHPGFINLKDSVNAAVASLVSVARAKNVQIRTHFDPDMQGEIYADATRLQQIIWNLISNSIKFTLNGGEISVDCKKDGPNCLIKVRDSGQGIEPAFLPYVFERFKQEDSSTTRKFGGLGLGLSIVRHLVELHGGQVSASSEGKGRGSEFTVTLPINPNGVSLKNSDGDSAVRMVERREVAMRLDGVKVLLVDDSDDNRKLISLILSRAGATVREAESAQQARDKMKDYVPDVIVSDIGMPEEDGVMFIKKLRSSQDHTCQKTPSVALTAYVRSEEIKQILEAGFQSHVPKPVSKNILIQNIYSLAHSRNQGSGSTLSF